MLLRHGPNHYMLGLDWTEFDGGSVQSHLREIVGDTGTAFYQVLGTRRDGQLVGYVDTAPALEGEGKKGKKAPKVYSLAAMIAMRGVDGIYFLDLGEHGWYAVIQGGQLMRGGGEMLMPLAHAIDAVAQLAASLELPVHASAHQFPDATPFSLSELDGQRKKPAPMEALKQGSGTGGASQLVGVIMLLAVLGAIGYGGWYTFLRKPVQTESPGDAAHRQAIQEYTRVMTDVLPRLDESPAWVIDAYRAATNTYPREVHGWLMDSLTCTAEQCGATYLISEDHTAFSLEGLKERFGAERVHLRDDWRTAIVTLDRPTTSTLWSLDEIMDPPLAPVSLVDAHGTLRVRVPQAKVEQTMHRESISQGMQPPLVAGIVREQINTSGNELYPVAVIGQLVDYLGPLGFVPETMELTTASQGREAAWRVAWVRLNREQR